MESQSVQNSFKLGSFIKAVLALIGLGFVLLFIGIILSSQFQDNTNEQIACLNRASENYTTNWNASCKKLDKEDKCDLPVESAKILDDRLANAKNDCYQLYK